jgi:hypothetical protein
MHRPLVGLVLCLVLIASAGCAVMSTMREVTSQTVEALRPSSFDGWDPGSETSDPWIQQAGAEARGDRPVEKEYDPLGLKKYVMSDKARDIERNMGIE